MSIFLKLKYELLKSVLLIVLFITMIVSHTQAVADDGFGRLFSSRHERNHLDNLRRNQQSKVIVLQEAQDKHLPESNALIEPAEQAESITLQGYVKRNDGSKSTLWINNQAVQENSTVGNVQIGRLSKGNFSKKRANADGLDADGVDVQIPANGKKVRLKAGQMYEPRTNQILEPQALKKAKLLKLDEMHVIDAGDEKSQY